jgi:hypothetical protein
MEMEVDGGGPRRNRKIDGGWLVRKNDRARNGGGQKDGAGLRTVVDGGKILGRWREGGKIWGEARGRKVRK